MLEITILEPEKWDEVNQVFIDPIKHTIRLEHSLVSLSKWESKWNRPFLSKQEMTHEEIMDYIHCMTLTPNVDPYIFNYLDQNNASQIKKYIESPMTATTIREQGGKASREIITSEIIYYWMITFNIPFECQTWHLNRLLTLIRVCSIKNQPPKKMSKRDILSQNAALNAARRKQLNTKG